MDTLPAPYRTLPHEAQCDGLRDAADDVVRMCRGCSRWLTRSGGADTTWTAPPPSALLGHCSLRLLTRD